MERDRTSGREESNHTLQQELNKRTEQVREREEGRERETEGEGITYLSLSLCR